MSAQEQWKRVHISEDAVEQMELERLRKLKNTQSKEGEARAIEIAALQSALENAETEERAKTAAFHAQLERAELEKAEKEAQLLSKDNQLHVMEHEKKVVGEQTKKILGYELSAEGEAGDFDKQGKSKKKKGKPKKKKTRGT